MNIGKHHQSLRYTCVECGISCICHTCAKLCHVGHTLIYRDEIVKLEIQKYEKTNKEQADDDALEIFKKDRKKNYTFTPVVDQQSSRTLMKFRNKSAKMFIDIHDTEKIRVCICICLYM
jgi:hypothetical protein